MINIKEIKNGTNFTMHAKLGCDSAVLLYLQASYALW